MNKTKCDEPDYIQFLVAPQNVFSSVEAAVTHPEGEGVVAHDAYTRLLQRLPPDSNGLWAEVEGCITRERGMLVIDDSTLEKPYAGNIARLFVCDTVFLYRRLGSSRHKMLLHSRYSRHTKPINSWIR